MGYEIKCSNCGETFLTTDELVYQVYYEDLGVWCEECTAKDKINN